MAEKRVAAVDIGTNTVLLLVADGSAARATPVVERATITRLGKDVDRTRRLSRDGMERTLACLTAYGALARELHVDRTVAVCTSAARDAENGREFLELASNALGATPRIIGGDEEARLVFDGALTGLELQGPVPVTVFDIGGGSTEIITGESAGERNMLQRAVSLDIGSVRLTERHVHHDPPITRELAAVQADIDAALAIVSFEAGRRLVGVAGTMTTLAAIHQRLASYDSGRVHGARLRKRDIESMYDRLVVLSLDERKRVPGLDPGRADVIVGGILIALRLLDRSGMHELLVSDRGVRWGLLLSALAAD